MRISRRGFVSGALASAAAAGGRPVRARGANERVLLALVGAGGRGMSVALDFAGRKDAEIGYVCDLHEGRLAAACERIGARQGHTPAGEKDLKTLLERKDLDAV